MFIRVELVELKSEGPTLDTVGPLVVDVELIAAFNTAMSVCASLSYGIGVLLSYSI
jgi:hypothetical protein